MIKSLAFLRYQTNVWYHFRVCFDSPSKRLVARAWIQNSHCGALFQSSRGWAFLDVRQSFRKHHKVQMWAVIFNRLPWFQSKNSRCWSIEKSLVVLSLLRPSEYDIGRTEWHENQQCLKYWGYSFPIINSCEHVERISSCV